MDENSGEKTEDECCDQEEDAVPGKPRGRPSLNRNLKHTHIRDSIKKYHSTLKTIRDKSSTWETLNVFGTDAFWSS